MRKPLKIMWSIKDTRIQVNSVWSCNSKYHGFSRGNLCYILFPVDPEAKLVAVQEAYKQYAINVLKKLLGENDIFASTPTDDFVFSPTFDYTMMSTQIKTEMAKLCLDKGYQLTPELPLVKGLGGTIIAKLNSTQLEALLLLLKDKGAELTNRNRATIARLENVALAK